MNYFTELFLQVIREDYHSDVEMISAHDYKVVDELRGENWRMFLMRFHGGYEIGLTTFDQGFTTFESQTTKPSKLEMQTIIRAYPELIKKIREWNSRYGELLVGSFNALRTMKYQRILGRNFKVGKINTFPPENGMPQAWYFKMG